MKSLPDTLANILKRIRDERLLWLIGILVLAIIAGLRDKIIFFAVLGIGVLVMVLGSFVSQRSRIPLAITFKDKDAIEIQISKCEFELRDGDNKLKRKGEMAFRLGMGGWECYLPKEATPEDNIRLDLTDRDGGKWETGPFPPLFPNREARKLK
jgi:hypothetical protein